jgi:hypothetical protein
MASDARGKKSRCNENEKYENEKFEVMDKGHVGSQAIQQAHRHMTN